MTICQSCEKSEATIQAGFGFPRWWLCAQCNDRWDHQEISVRLVNILRREGCVTVTNASKRSEQQWRDVYGIGKLTLDEMKGILREKGMEFSDHPHGWVTDASPFYEFCL